MLHPVLSLLVLALGSAAQEPILAEASILPARLRCEWQAEPRGVTEPRPVLDWMLAATDADARGLSQSAWRVLVASSPERLAAGEADLWDSGRVAGGEARASYTGAPLRSNQECFWQVRAWDQAGRASAWSPVATWTMGLLEQEDWRAAWIGHDRARDEVPARTGLEGARWIWFADDPVDEAPAESRYFHKSFDLPTVAEVETAALHLTADDQFELWVNGEPAATSDGRGDAWRRPVTVDLAGRLRPGRNVLAVAATNSGGPAGLIARLEVRIAGREPLEWLTDESWRSTPAPAFSWQRRQVADPSWQPARVLAPYGEGPWGRFTPGGLLLPPPRVLRGDFTARGALRRAVVHATALGLYELRLNGSKVGDGYFEPGWTDYDTRVYSRSFEVTDAVRAGANTLGALLADGWYSGYVGYGSRRDHYGEALRFRAQLHLFYADGSEEIVATGPDWRAATGPLREADFLMGEVYDARLEQPGWDAPGFDAAAWAPVDMTDAIDAVVQAHPGPPVRAIAEFPPVAVTEPQPGVWVYDLGQNFAGFARLRVEGAPGQAVQLRFAERLNPDGTIYTTNLRGARATDRYVCRGGGTEEWTPRFTFHGFQYVELTGLDGPPRPDAVTGIALSSDTPRTGWFECSDPMLEQLFSNIHWTQRANFIDVPTDCPQRDERLGWTGDAQAYVGTAAWLCDVQAFFAKWLVDLDDAQRADGQFPMVAPLKVAGSDGGPGWADAGIICPWEVYRVYGDRRVLVRHYDAMARYIDFCVERSTEDLLPPAEFHCFGDWVSVGADTPKELIYSAYFAHSADLMSRSADALGRDADAARYRELFARLRRAFYDAYVQPDGSLRGDTQCAYVLALAFDLLDGAQRDEAARRLVADIEARGGHLSTGFLGTKDIMHALSAIGREDVAWRLLQKDTYPSWGFSIRHGATSIWERWNGWTPEQGFMDPGMNSFAHYAFGAVGQWILENVGGIQTAAPGYEVVRIRPRPSGTVTWARTRYDSVRGPIRSGWALEGGALRLEVEIPPNATAEIHVPAASASAVRESGRPAAEAPGLRWLRMEDGAAVFAAGSGVYRFTAPRP